MPAPQPDQDSQAYTEYRTPTREQITERAHALWEAEGRPEGRAHEHWFAAERALQYPNTIEDEVTQTVPPTPPAPTGEVGEPARRPAVAASTDGAGPADPALKKRSSRGGKRSAGTR